MTTEEQINEIKRLSFRDELRQSDRIIVLELEIAQAKEIIRDCAESLSRLPDTDGAFRVTALKQAQQFLGAKIA